jgi:cytochrome c55X
LLALGFSAFAEPLSEERIAELHNLLKQDCGSCHGMTLKGGLGPALTVEALKNKPIELITVTISEGRPGTPMPPWKHLLSKDDINWLAKTLKQQQVARQ